MNIGFRVVRLKSLRFEGLGFQELGVWYSCKCCCLSTSRSASASPTRESYMAPVRDTCVHVCSNNLPRSLCPTQYTGGLADGMYKKGNDMEQVIEEFPNLFPPCHSKSGLDYQPVGI